jgi:hypothetical protein
MHGPDVPVLPVALLASSSGYVGATDTTSTLAVTTSEGHTGVTFGQPSSNDHAGESGLPATDQKTHLVSHFGVSLVVGALLHPRRPR